jgi:hypothetical protein
MNSRYLEDTGACRRDYDRDRVKKTCDVALRCSTPGTVNIPILADPGATYTATSLTVNTRNFDNPCIRLDFTSNINLPVGFLGTLTFQVYKQCRNNLAPVPIGPAFTFARTVALIVGESSSFSFFICDCDSCGDDCCTYSVVITNTTPILLGATVTNATLSSLAVDQNRCGC